MASGPDPKQSIILNVDDNEGARYTKTRVLRAAGYTVFDAGTAAEALEIAVRQQPHLAVLDVKLPDMDGITLARVLKSDPLTAATLILQTSATFVQGIDRVRSLEGGADSYLVEPLEPGELLANVHALLRLSHAEKRLRENDRLLRLATQAAHLSVWSAQIDSAEMIDTGKAASTAEQAQIAALQAPQSAGDDQTSATVHPEDRPLLEAALRRAIADTGEYEVEYRVISDIGEARWIASHAMLLRDAFGRPAQLTGVIQDITARKQAQIEREILLTREQAARREAEEATRLKDEFLATLSHELRTPLNAIMGWVHLLRSGRLSTEDAARGIDVIKRNADAQSELINDLLDVSRIVSGKMRLDAKPVALDVLVEAAIDSIRPTADAKGVVLQSILGTSAGVVSGDAERLQQVVWNLLSNAVKFSRRGGKVQVCLERQESRAVISVTDTGSGISPEFLPYVFHPFRQAENATVRTTRGLGLGLAIVHHLVELHGGEVTAESAGEGRGATFRVSLPIIAALPERMGSRGSPLTREGDPDLTSLTVLVVDDEPDARDIMRRMLENAGASVQTAASVPEAMHLVECTRFSVLVSDISMPGQDGYALIGAVRRHADSATRNTPALALTAHARGEDRLRALAAGFQLHVSKPVHAQEFIAAVANISGKRA